MGKRAKKKVQTAPAKVSVAGSRLSPSTASLATSLPAEGDCSGENRSAGSVGAGCPHGPNLEKLRTQLAKSALIHCLECAKLRSGAPGTKERRGGGGGSKGKTLAKKKGHHPGAIVPISDDKSSLPKVWICLSCGYAGCGSGNSSFTTSNGGDKRETKLGLVGRGHAWQHWLQLKHPIVMRYGDEFSCWCFHCEVSHDQEHCVELSSSQDPVESGVEALPASPSRLVLLQQSAKLLQEKLMEQGAAEAKDEAGEGGGDQGEARSATSEPPALTVTENGMEEPGEVVTNKRVIKGLMNLGNTCFFNSVMQNLLGVEVLREHFISETPEFEGPLTSSLRKFYQETSVALHGELSGSAHEAGTKRGTKARGGWSGVDGIHNPKGLFGAICSKAPRFKGFQQQDSHELLKCLLDGLHTEEESARKASSALSEKVSGTENGSVTNRNNQGDNVGAHVDGNAVKDEKTVQKIQDKTKQAPVETFVEKIFGGQLSSTVSCCECGHSSVVYEPFLDLSLSIPSRKPSKRLSPVQNVSEQSTSVALNKRAQALKGAKGLQPMDKPSSMLESDDDVLKSSACQISGQGAPLLLLPPPPRDSNGHYINLGTETDDNSWLDFLDTNEDLESQTVFGCAPNPEFQVAMARVSNPDSELLQDETALSHAGASDALNGDSNSYIGLCLPSVDTHPVGHSMGVDTSDIAIMSSDGHTFSKPSTCELLLLEAAKDSGSDSYMNFNVCDSEKSTFVISRQQDADTCTQIKGGSDSQLVFNTEEAEVNYYDSQLLPETSRCPSMSVEQSGGGCDDNSKLQSEPVGSQNGTILLLDYVNCNGITETDPEPQGDYDGVASLFDEEETGEDVMLGPLPLNHDRNNTFEDIGLDDVLDMSKVCDDGREDWLVPIPDKPEEETDEVAMSLEGCLQIFTKAEVLSGENAWGCENCTKKYYEKLSAKSSISMAQKIPVKRIIRKGRSDACSSSIRKSDVRSQAVGKPLKGTEKEEVEEEEEEEEEDVSLDLEANGKLSDVDAGCLVNCDCPEEGLNTYNSDVSHKDQQVEDIETMEAHPLSSIENQATMSCDIDTNGNYSLCSGNDNLREDIAEDATLKNAREVRHCPETQCGNAGNAGNPVEDGSSGTSVKIIEVDDDSEPDGVKQVSSNGKVSLETQLPNLSGELQNEGKNREDAEANVPELEKRMSPVSPGSSERSSKLKKCRSRNKSEEPRIIIKQDATKRYLISRAPPVLTIQLKRFARDIRGRLSKLSGHVAFDEWLDLHPFLDHRNATSTNCRYRLTGTVEHSGTLKGGHYVAYVRGPPVPNATSSKLEAAGASLGASSWYYISDSHVRQTNLEAVLHSEAYLLFYERCSISRGEGV